VQQTQSSQYRESERTSLWENMADIWEFHLNGTFGHMGKYGGHMGKYGEPMKLTYTVTLNMRNRRKARNTESPKEPAFGLKCVHTTSNTLPEMTRQSNRLNEDS
jgi:hypothetical protein